MLVGYKQGNRAVILFGFAKSDLDNVKEEQLAELRLTGQRLRQSLPDSASRQICRALRARP